MVKGPNGDQAKLRSVTMGQDDGTTVQIIGGLDANSQVIQDPPDSLIDGEAVRVVTARPDTRNRELLGMNRRVSLSGLALPFLDLDPDRIPGLRLQGRTQLSAALRSHCSGIHGGCRVPPPNPPNGGWKQVAPADSAIRGNWWEVYNDPQLNELEEKVTVSNQSLKAAYDAYMQALTAVQVFRSQYFPTVSVSTAAQNEQRRAIVRSTPQHYSPGSITNYNDLLAHGAGTVGAGPLGQRAQIR